MVQPPSAERFGHHERKGTAEAVPLKMEREPKTISSSRGKGCRSIQAREQSAMEAVDVWGRAGEVPEERQKRSSMKGVQ